MHIEVRTECWQMFSQHSRCRLGFTTGIGRIEEVYSYTTTPVSLLITPVYYLTIKSTRCTTFLNLFLDWKSTCFGQFLCPLSGIFHCNIQQCYMSYRFADSLRAGSGCSNLILLAVCQKTCRIFQHTNSKNKYIFLSPIADNKRIFL
jgi:hypothetical protein